MSKKITLVDTDMLDKEKAIADETRNRQFGGYSVGGTSANGDEWGYIPVVKKDGGIELGQYIDLHLKSNDGVDRSARLRVYHGDEDMPTIKAEGATAGSEANIVGNHIHAKQVHAEEGYYGKLGFPLKITLNGTEFVYEITSESAAAFADSVKFYAPKSAGSNNQILLADDNGAPVWADSAPLATAFKHGDTTVSFDNLYEGMENLKNEASTLAPAAINALEGKLVSIDDGAERPLQGLSLYGKSVQNDEPSIDEPCDIASAGDMGSITAYVTGAQLLDTMKFTDKTINGVSFVKNEDGSIKVSGTATAFVMTNGVTVDLPAGTYSISGGGRATTCRITRRDGTKTYYSNGSFTIDGTEEVWVYIQFQAGETVDTTIYPMLNVGSSALPWEAYKVKTVTVDTSDGLCGIPVESGGNYTDEDGQQWICDTIEFNADGTGKYVKRVTAQAPKTPISANETSDRPGRFIISAVFEKRFKSAGYASLCSHGVFNSWGFGKAVCDVFAVNGANFYYFPPESMTADEVTEKLNAIMESDEPLLFVGALAEAEETELTPEEVEVFKTLSAHKGATNVFTGDIGNVGVEYTVDTKTYIDNKFNELQNAIISLGGNI